MLKIDMPIKLPISSLSIIKANSSCRLIPKIIGRSFTSDL